MDPVEQIKSSVDIVDYIGAHVSLRKRGRQWVGLCPFHGEKTPSFHVDRERRMFKCFGCGEGGDIFRFVMKMDNLTFREALERLAERAHVTLDNSERSRRNADVRERLRAAYAEAARFFAGALWANPAVLKYVRDRGINDESARAFGLGWAPAEWDALIRHLRRIGWTDKELIDTGLAVAGRDKGVYDRFRSRLMFPIFDLQNRVIAFGGRIIGDGEPKYLNSPETGIFSKSRTLFGLNFAHKAIQQADTVVVMEGYTDVLAAHQAGCANAVATLGTALTSDHVQALARYAKTIVLAFDADSAGIRAALRAGPLFEESDVNVRILELPGGHDPDTYLRAEGAQAFQHRVDTSRSLADFQLDQIQAHHDLATDEGRSAYVREAIAVLASIRNPMRREPYIRRLAEEWSVDNLSSVSYREEEIRRALRNYGKRVSVSTDKGRAGTPGTSSRDSTALEPAGTSDTIGGKKTPSGAAVNERILLRALLIRPDWLDDLELKIDHFAEPAHRALAELVIGREGDPLQNLAGWPEEIARLATDLNMSEDPLSLEVARQALVYLQTCARQKRLAELKAELASGSIDRNDPRWIEWSVLQRESRLSDRTRVQDSEP